ncbi:RHS repeat domain-containing protein [Paraliomyxa miuraensis]|uniref:RHS repeat domain-containing protein n=3 Tax=Paraliomyxa miuraensis TaxID=376150 RepID=UPI002256F40B|nr:hypothetical protein [Paraliomyxa miuraensis]MCX4240087.1 hypothetical protein [Paraliomyxa miuraensis]
MRLDEIAYAGKGSEASRRHVRFDYVARTDVSWGYVAGVVQGRTERLETITVEGPYAQVIATYVLNYDVDPLSGRSRIEWVKKCDTAGACLPQTTFEWSAPGGAAGSLSMSFVPYGVFLGPDAELVDDPVPFASSPTRLVGDFDGDSDHDLLYFTDAGWRIWDGTSQFDLLDTPVVVSWPTVLPEGDAYVEALIEAEVDAALAAVPDDEELTAEEEQALVDAAAAVHLDRLQPGFSIMVIEANGDLRDDLLIPRRDLTGGPWVDAWGYRFAQDVVVAVAATPEGESAPPGFSEPVSFVEEDAGLTSAPIYTVVPLDHDGDGLTDLWLCQGDGYKSGRWVLAKRGPDPAAASGHYHFTTYDSGVGCSVHDELLVTSLRGGRQELLVVPAYATGPGMPVPADFASPQAYHEEYLPLSEDQRTDYLALAFEPGGPPGSLKPTGLPRDQYQRWHDRRCRNGLAGAAFGRPLASAGLGLDKLADVNGDGLVDVVRYELASGDHPGNPELPLGLHDGAHWDDGILCGSDVEANIPTVIRPYVNTGDGFVPGSPMHVFQGNPHANLWLGFVAAQLYDFDLDGIVDLLLPSSGAGGDWTAVVSNGDGTYTDHAVGGIPSGWPAYTDDATWRERTEAATRLQVMTLAPAVHERAQITFLGYVEDNPTDWPYLINTFATNYSKPHNRVTTITNGLGAIVEIDYETVSTTGAHGISGPHTYPRTGAKGAMAVVTRHATQANPQADLEVDRYAYHDAVVDAWGQGLLGFGEVERWREGQLEHHTWIRYAYDRDDQHADYPTAGRPVEQLEQRRVVDDAGAVQYWLTRTQQQLETVVEPRLGGDTLFTYPARQDVDVFVRDVSCTIDCEFRPSERFQWLTIEQERDGLGTIVSSTTTNDAEQRIYEVDAMLDDQAAWIVGRAEAWSEQSCVGGGCVERAHTATYDPATGAVTSSTFAPNDTVARLDTTYGYDGRGNVITTTLTNLQDDVRTTTTTWDAEGVHPESMINAAGHESWVIHEPGTGVPVAEVAADGVTWVHRYDGFLRPTRHERRVSPMGLPDGHVTTIEYALGGPVHDDTFQIESALRVRTTAPDGQELTTDYGATGHVMQEAWWGMQALDEVPINTGGHGDEVYVSTLYDGRGRVHRRSLPTWASEQPSAYITTEYDGLDRVTDVEHPDGDHEYFAYGLLAKGLQIAHTDESDATSLLQTDAASRVAVSIDPHGTSTCFEYGAFGVLGEVRRDCTDPHTPWVSTYEHDVAGRIVAETDPSFGTRTRLYNGFGELLEQSDGAGEVIGFEYDALGRVLERHDTDGDTTHTYDVIRPGRLHTSEGPDDILTTYGYDASGRLDTVTVSDLMLTVPGALELHFDYGLGDRLQTLHYPSVDGDRGLRADYDYDGAGYLRRVRVGGATVLWSALQADEAGRLTLERFGNGLETTRTYEPLTGLPTTVQTDSPGNLVQSLDYDWHPWGEIEQRSDLVSGQQEAFEHDDLRRLTQASVTAALGGSVVDVSYDDVGNITHKTDVGSYVYEDGRLFAYGIGVPVLMGYDARGNVVDHGGRTLTYTPFDKVRQIVDGAETLDFRYDAQGNRFSRHSALEDDLTVVVQGLYERREVAGALRLTYRVPAAGRTVAQIVRTPGLGGFTEFGKPAGSGVWNDAIEFLHDDHLGSTDVVTDDTGAVLRRASFDPWGQARDAEDWTQPIDEDVLDLLGVGFTGHPARLDAGLVDMGGRMYHPRLGRFFLPTRWWSHPSTVRPTTAGATCTTGRSWPPIPPATPRASVARTTTSGRCRGCAAPRPTATARSSCPIPTPRAPHWTRGTAPWRCSTRTTASARAARATTHTRPATRVTAATLANREAHPNSRSE